MTPKMTPKRLIHPKKHRRTYCIYFSTDRQKYLIKIDGKEYGSGEGANRTIAKNIAALETLKLLIPDFQPDDKFMLTGRAEQDYGYFNHLFYPDVSSLSPNRV